MLAARGIPIISSVVIFGVLSLITVSLRCYVRIRLIKAFGTDDYLMTAAFLLYLGFTAVCILGVHYGVGKHMWELDDFHKKRAMLMWWIAYILYGIIITLTKVSVGLFLLRVTLEKKPRLLLWHAIHVTILAGTIFIFLVAFQCTPASFFWTRFLDHDRPEGKCINISAYVGLGYYFSVICIITDFIFGLMPFWIVRNLRLESWEKVILIPILSMASFATFAPAVRMASLESLRSDDYLYATTPIALWSALEPGVAIFASSLATLRPLARYLRGISAAARSTTPDEETPPSTTRRKATSPLDSVTVGSEERHSVVLERPLPMEVEKSEDIGDEDKVGSGGSRDTRRTMSPVFSMSGLETVFEAIGKEGVSGEQSGKEDETTNATEVESASTEEHDTAKSEDEYESALELATSKKNSPAASDPHPSREPVSQEMG